MNTITPTLATGAALSQQTFNDFVARLKHDCIGPGANDHCTADAIFIVQKRVRIYGLDEDYAEGKLIVSADGECEYQTPEELYKFHDEELDNESVLFSDGEYNFLELGQDEQWEVIEQLEGFNIVHFVENWEYVCAHHTKAAAEAFIKRKKHDYRELRVYVDGQTHCWEFNAIKEGLLNGSIVFKNND